ncbi:MAG TPA: proline--tRNA ligase [Patescibacteria group bacterium]|nr:proline--tRNA ligase [Patescibacteria group bacterium]
MKQSKLFTRTQKQAPKDATSVSHKFLVQGGFIDMLMAGVYTYLPLGWKVINKISDVVREEMNATGAQEMLMPTLQPKNIWDETGRWESLEEVMYQFKDRSDKDTGLGATHEEVIYDIVRRNISSYKEVPFAIYQIQNKFRNELRPKGGIMRGREFIMKDLYSFHLIQADLDKYYNEVTQAYKRVYERCGLQSKVVEASGGIFTKKYSHEFQVVSDAGEDNIIYCDKCDYAQNVEISKLKLGDECPKCAGSLKDGKSIEVGNIFQFGDKYAKDMNGYATDKDGKKQPILMASYGIGISRLVASIVEIYHDQQGIIWPEAVAPYQVHLISIQQDNKADKVYDKLVKAGVEVLYDDRDISAGEKFADADLIGIPLRAVISTKTGEQVEVKKRGGDDVKMLNIDEVKKVSKNF